MDKKTKIVPMSNGKTMIIPKPAEYFSISEKEYLIHEYLTSSISKNALWKKYTGKEDHGRFIEWMRNLGYGEALKQEKVKFVEKKPIMDQEKLEVSQQLRVDQSGNPSEQQLTEGQSGNPGEQQPKIEELERQLKLSQKELELAQIKVIAYSTMIDLAEKEFNIPIRKK